MGEGWGEGEGISGDVGISASPRPSPLKGEGVSNGQSGLNANQQDAHYGCEGESGEGSVCEVLVKLARRSAFSTTSSELADMPIPATQGVTWPSAARGMAIKL